MAVTVSPTIYTAIQGQNLTINYTTNLPTVLDLQSVTLILSKGINNQTQNFTPTSYTNTAAVFDTSSMTAGIYTASYITVTDLDEVNFDSNIISIQIFQPTILPASTTYNILTPGYLAVNYTLQNVAGTPTKAQLINQSNNNIIQSDYFDPNATTPIAAWDAVNLQTGTSKYIIQFLDINNIVIAYSSVITVTINNDTPLIVNTSANAYSVNQGTNITIPFSINSTSSILNVYLSLDNGNTFPYTAANYTTNSATFNSTTFPIQQNAAIIQVVTTTNTGNSNTFVLNVNPQTVPIIPLTYTVAAGPFTTFTGSPLIINFEANQQIDPTVGFLSISGVGNVFGYISQGFFILGTTNLTGSYTATLYLGSLRDPNTLVASTPFTITLSGTYAQGASQLQPATFTWKNRNSKDWNFYLETNAEIKTAAARIIEIDILGRSGSLQYWAGDYAPFDLDLTGWVDISQQAFSVPAFKDWLSGFSVLQLSNYPNVGWYGYISSEVVLSYKVGNVVDVNFTLKLQPFAYLIGNGFDPTTYSTTLSAASNTLFNPGTAASQPIIKIVSSSGGSGSIVVNDQTFSITDMQNGMLINSEAYDTYTETGAENLSALTAGPYPIFIPGNNTIKLNNITSIQVYPRWRNL